MFSKSKLSSFRNILRMFSLYCTTFFSLHRHFKIVRVLMVHEQRLIIILPSELQYINLMNKYKSQEVQKRAILYSNNLDVIIVSISL